MNIISQIQMYMYIIIGTMIAMAVAGALIAYYFLKIKKVSAEEEEINYDNFVRKDSLEYCKFDDIIACGSDGKMGMIHMGNNVFVAGIEIQGYNYEAASAAEQHRTMMNAIAFFNGLENPIQMCQTVQAIDITRNIDRAKSDAERIEIELLTTQQEIKMATDNLREFIDNDELYTAEEARVKKLITKFNSLDWQLQECKELIHYMEMVSDTNFNTKRSNQIMFSYEYNPDNDLEELSEEEIVTKAEYELRTMAGIYGSSLENTGCSWKILSPDNLTNLLRRHFHPLTCDAVKLEELFNSSYNSLYIKTDSFEELERERRGDIEYENSIKEYQEMLKEKERLAEEERKKTVERLEEEAEKVV